VVSSSRRALNAAEPAGCPRKLAGSTVWLPVRCVADSDCDLGEQNVLQQACRELLDAIK
jgi:hypothetical protein